MSLNSNRPQRGRSNVVQNRAILNGAQPAAVCHALWRLFLARVLLLIFLLPASAVSQAADQSANDRDPKGAVKEQRADGAAEPMQIEHEIGVVPFQHEFQVNSISWLDDGKSLLTTSQDGLRIWDVAAKTIALELPDAVENWLYASTDRSRRRIAHTGSQSGTRVLEWPSRKTVFTLPQSRGAALALSPDGKKLAVALRKGENDGILQIIDADTGDLLAEHFGPPTLALCWSPDSLFLAAGENRGIVIFLKPDGTLVRPGIRLEEPEPPAALAFDESGKRLAIVTITGTTGVWRMSDRKPVWIWKSPFAKQNIAFYNAIGGAAFAQGDKHLIARSSRTAIVFDAETGKMELDEKLDIPGGYANIALSPDRKILARSTGRNAVDLIDIATLQSTLAKDVAYPHCTRDVLLSPDNQVLLAFGEQRLDFWHMEPLQFLGGLALRSYCNDTCWSPDSRRVAVVCRSSQAAPPRVEIVDAANRTVVSTLNVEDKLARGVAFTRDGQCLAVAEFRQLSFWDVASATKLWRVPACDENDWLENIAISPDARQVAATIRFGNGPGLGAEAAGGGIHLFRGGDGNDVGKLVTAGTPERIEFLDDSTLLAGMNPFTNVNQPSPALVEWDMKAQQLKPERSVAFVRDGNRGTVISHNAKTRRVLVQYRRNTHDSTDFENWCLDPLEQVRQFDFTGNISGGQLLSNDRVALVKANGNVVILRPRPVSERH